MGRLPGTVPTISRGENQDEIIINKSSSIYGRGKRIRLWVTGLLIGCKIFTTLGAFVYADVLKVAEEGKSRLFGHYAVTVHSVALIQFTSGIVYFLIRKPSPCSKTNGTTGSEKWIKFGDFVRILRNAFLGTIILLGFSVGLELCGPLTAIIITAHDDFIIASVTSGIFVGRTGSRFRGGILFFLGVLVLFFNEDKLAITPTLISSQYQYLTPYSIGVLILWTISIVRLGKNALASNLATDLGGIQRVDGLGGILSGSFLTLVSSFAILHGDEDLSGFWSRVPLLFFVVIAGFIVDTYVGKIVSGRLERRLGGRWASCVSLYSAALISLLWLTNEPPNFSSFAALALVSAGVILVSGREEASGGGSLVGYSSDGLPLFNFQDRGIEEQQPSYSSYFFLALGTLLRHLKADGGSRRRFLFLFLNSIVGLTLLTAGDILGHVGLLAEGTRQTIKAALLFSPILNNIVRQIPPTKSFPFGFGRVEVLYEFLLSLCMCLLSPVIASGSLRTFLLETPQISPPPIVGFLCFVALITSLSRPFVTSSQNSFKGLFLRVGGEIGGLIPLIIGYLWGEWWGLLGGIAGIISAALLLYDGIPLLANNTRMLALGGPVGLERRLQGVLLQILAMDGVKGYKEPRFWTFAHDITTGSLHVQVTAEAAEQEVWRSVNDLFLPLGFAHFTTQIEKEEFVARRSSPQSSNPPSPTSSI